MSAIWTRLASNHTVSSVGATTIAANTIDHEDMHLALLSLSTLMVDGVGGSVPAENVVQLESSMDL